MSESTLYYFYSVGCGWCKKTEPLVDELNESGDYEILKLDLILVTSVRRARDYLPLEARPLGLSR